MTHIHGSNVVTNMVDMIQEIIQDAAQNIIQNLPLYDRSGNMNMTLANPKVLHPVTIHSKESPMFPVTYNGD